MIICSSLLLVLSSCGQNLIRGEAPDMEDLIGWADTCSEVYHAQIAAWDSRDADQLREVYTADIVHFDGEPAFIGIDEVVIMARSMWMLLDDWGMAAGRTYVSQNDCFGDWINWGFGGYGEDNPRSEFDLVEIRDGKISYWRLFYDPNWDNEPMNVGLLEDFGTAWSSGKPQAVAALYAEDAVLEDSLFGINANGREQIERVAAGFKRQHARATWELVTPFDEGADPAQPDLLPSVGGIYEISIKGLGLKTCPVQAAVILTPDREGLIARQLTMYAAEDLIECQWVK